MTDIVLGLGFITALLVALAALLHAAREILLPARPVTITVNGSKAITGSANRKLLDILNENGIPVPSACAGAGTCGLCRVDAVAGAAAPLPTERARLSPADLRAGARLACQVVVRSDLAVTVDEAILGMKTLAARVVSTTPLTPLIREIVLALPEGTDFPFRAGGFVQVTAPAHTLSFTDIDLPEAHRDAWRRLGIETLASRSAGPVARAYSIASRPRDAGRIVLNIRLATPPPSVPGAPPGIVSAWLFSRAPGDTVEIAGPYGHFGAQDTEREMVFIGGGVGMAPLRAIIADQLERIGTHRRISFWYGARSAAELFYRQEFEDLARRFPNFSFTPALSEPEASAGWDGATGFIHDVAYTRYLRDHPAPEDAEYYLCGPPLMIEAVYAMLADCGVEPGAIFNDDFGI
ncbi:NADH:ubiquinone reductase (Na(+)-transporting) subunit F [Arsenicitalea aurantiaca]|uniref:Na(+)-translocating NADH-quinone reductase subunit F n=1 Tax=Arsenicitalea aurantiaca TaxID=1783274 RepID=A0A433XK80_9HYPH|nr:NADH:ubiquinone reductase (Na(+)-transporting) subunit F [Arsenicitalea aurantiaca]RUT34486.1 NADH:ubiquinone reductase (Na(+)-transporting) subunit F [Arsenicitalea aurantiaca]